MERTWRPFEFASMHSALDLLEGSAHQSSCFGLAEETAHPKALDSPTATSHSPFKLDQDIEPVEPPSQSQTYSAFTIDAINSQEDLPSSASTDCFLESALQTDAVTAFHSWESFRLQTELVPPAIRYLSESSIESFNTALNQASLTTEKVLPHDVARRAATSLLLGQSSLFFIWEDKNSSFVPTLDGNAISGLSSAITSGLWHDLAEQGILYRRLRDASDQAAPARFRLATLATLRAEMVNVLDGIEEYVLSHRGALRSTVQIQHLSDRLRPILDVLWQAHTATRALTSDSKVVAYIKELSFSLSSSLDMLSPLVAALTHAVCRPWLYLLLQDYGFLDQEAPSTQIQTMDTTFLNPQDVHMLEQVKQSMAYLRRFAPEDENLHGSVSKRLRHLIYGGLLTDSHEYDQMELRSSSSVNEPFSFEAAIGSQHPPSEIAHHSTVQITVKDLLENRGTGDPWLPTSDPNAQDLLSTVRPLIIEHARLSSQSVIDHIFDVCELDKYLKLRHRFFLFGDPEFVDRLRVALFGPIVDDEGQARRAHSLILNNLEDVKWPPLSSKLSLSLTGILSGSEDLTRVSFTVRQLSEEQMEKACDPVSIHALDFLQLHLDMPPALQEILGTESNAHYDAIFGCLLLYTRMLHLVTKLHRTRPSVQPGLVHRMHHAISTLAAHAIQSAVSLSWKHMLREIAAARREKDLDRVKKAHAHCLEQMRSKLFLRRRHLSVRHAIEGVCSQVLDSARVPHALTSALFDSSVTGLTGALRSCEDPSDPSAFKKDDRLLQTLLGRLSI